MKSHKSTGNWGREKANRMYADGGAVSPAIRWMGRVKLRNEMGGEPPWTAINSQRDPTSARDEMRGQMQRAQETADEMRGLNETRGQMQRRQSTGE